MLNGAYPGGRPGSVNEPGRLVGAKLLLKTSIRRFRKSAAYKNVPDPDWPMASPVYPAPDDPWGTTSVATGPAFQASIVPCSVPKMNVDGRPFKGNLGVGLYTTPVGP